MTGILTAPKKGADTRKDIKNKANEVTGAAEKNLKDLYKELSKHYDSAKEQIANAAGKGKAELEDLMPKLEESRDKLKELLSSIRDGDVDASTVKKAIKDTEATIKKAAKKL